MKRIVIALGGNALQEAGKPATAESQLEVVEKTSEYIADIIESGYDVVLAHGNGPQVGRIVLQNEYASAVTPAMPFDVCGAMSQGYIGYHMQQGLEKVLRARKNGKRVVTVVTQVVVDKDDPKFKAPSKPIGPFYTEDEARKLEAEKGYTMKEDAGRGWRRVVASPMPVEIVELDAVKCLMNGCFIAITVGGGGIPVYRPLPKFPAVTRDIAVVCAESVTVGALEDCIRRGAKGLLKKVELFDIYRGIGVTSGSKSVAFSLTLRADDRSLTGEEADEDVKSILALLEAELGAKLR